jgi:replicative DNA helicase
LSSTVYPYADDFQEGVVSLYCQDPGFRRQYNDVVQSDYFDDDALIHIIRTAKKIHNKGRMVTKQAIEADFVDAKSAGAFKAPRSKKFQTQFRDMLNVVFNSDLEPLDYIPDMAVSFARSQAVADACHKIVTILDRGGNIEAAKSLMDTALQVGAARDLGHDFYDAAADIGMLKKSMMHDEGQKVPTGLASLDKNMRGGLSLGELGMIIGPTGRGKSIVLVNLAAEALLAGKNVVYITFELFEHEVLLRFFQNLTGCTDEEVLEEEDDFRHDLNTLLKKGKHHLRIKYFPPGTLSSVQLRAYLARLQSVDGWSPDLLILDDADSMRIPKPGKADSSSAATYQALGILYSDIISILVDFTCCSWVACQATRSAFDAENVDLSHTADSFKKAHKANMALAVCQTPEEGEKDEARLFVAKARAYKSGYYIPIKFTKALMKIEERQTKVKARILHDTNSGSGLDGKLPKKRKSRVGKLKATLR